MRKIVLDTETTGLNPLDGHRIIEIGCVELEDNLPTGKEWHTYLNPERAVPEAAQAVHGLDEKFLSDKPFFKEVYSDFISFLGEAELVIHNAKFDIGFLNNEIIMLKKPLIEMTKTIDTVHLARKLIPGAAASLDALCKRFNIDISKREKHGALLDAQLLAEVYLELTGGRQASLVLEGPEEKSYKKQLHDNIKDLKPNTLKATLTEEELNKHNKLIKKMKSSVWLKQSL